MNSILVVVDMQQDFVSGALGTAEARAIVPLVANHIRDARESGAAIWFTLDTHHADYPDTAEGHALPVVHCIEGTEGHGLVQEIDAAREERDVVIEKPTFGSERLADLLGDVAKTSGSPDGRELSIELCGVCTDICVVTNALLIKTRLPEARVSVRARLCAGVTEQKHEAALEVMRSCQIDVMD